MEHVHAELRRISARLAAYPDPFEHAGLYAAQQALAWAMQPEAFASPVATVLGSEEGSGDCWAESHPLQS
jgi:hypothetical protein